MQVKSALQRVKFPRLIQPFSRADVLEVLFLTALAACAYFVFLWHLGDPPMLFWDENYHLAAANKYLAGVMFMEPHPPLGKLLMAFSEWLFGTNAALPHDVFLNTDHVKSVPAGYSFWPGRLPSALGAAMGAFVLYFILCETTQYRIVAAVFTGFYLFDNAIALQSRAAMLEGIQFFFLLLAIWAFVRALRREIQLRHYIWLGVFTGLAAAVKLTGLICLLLVPALWLWERGGRVAAFLRQPSWRECKSLFRSAMTRGGLAFFLTFFVIAAAYYVHIGLGARTVEDRYYQASPTYTQWLKEGDNPWNPIHFWTKLRDNIHYIPHWEAGVPALKPYDPKEGGSHPLRWLMGGKTINGRWDKGGAGTRYLTLTGNPVAWNAGLAGVALSFVFAIGRGLGEFAPGDRRLFHLMLVFLMLWLCYMLEMLGIKRVMYMYHYLIPLIFSWILAALCFCYIFRRELAARSAWLWGALLLLAVQNAVTFVYFAPFTYHQPLTHEECENRNWSSFWEINCVE